MWAQIDSTNPIKRILHRENSSLQRPAVHQRREELKQQQNAGVAGPGSLLLLLPFSCTMQYGHPAYSAIWPPPPGYVLLVLDSSVNLAGVWQFLLSHNSLWKTCSC